MTFPIYLAHDHMQRAEDFSRDLKGGVTGKILHLTVDSWIEAPNREQFEATYYTYDGFLERGLAAASRVLDIAADPVNSVMIVRTMRDLSLARERGQLAVILGNEGAKILKADISLVDAWWWMGLRHVQFNWAMRNLVGSCQVNEDELESTGLTEFGRAVVERMNRLGMIVDVSHSSPQTISDVLAVTTRPILNSHSGSRKLADKQQNLWDQQIRNMADNGGVIGMHLCSRLVLGVNDRQAQIPDLVRQIRYVRDVGGIDVVGLGPDWVLGDPERDANYLRNTNQQDMTWTRGLEDSSTIADLAAALESDGFTSSEIEKIMGGNLLRLFGDTLPD